MGMKMGKETERKYDLPKGFKFMGTDISGNL